MSPDTEKRYVLITRPREDSGALAAPIEARGYGVAAEPVLSIEPLPAVWPEDDAYRGLVLTSTNALRQIPGNLYRGLPVYAVGARTASAASQAGFKNVTGADGDARALESVLTRKGFAPGTRLFHPCGEDSIPLNVSGTVIERKFVYRAVPVGRLGESTAALLDRRAVAAALFFSPRTAAVFKALLLKARKKDSVTSIDALCLSHSVLESLKDLPWKATKVAAHTDRESLLALLDAQGEKT